MVHPVSDLEQGASARAKINATEARSLQNESDIAQNAADIASIIAGSLVSQPGDLKPIAHDSVPSGWLLCDGSEYDETVYSDLFAVIGTLWNTGGETPGFFRVPDGRKRSLIGKDLGTVATDTVGKAGGTFDHDHTIDPPNTSSTIAGDHLHTVDPPNTTSGAPSDNSQSSNGLFAGTASPTSAHNHDVDIPQFNSGSAGDHSHDVDIPQFNSGTNNSPFMVGNWIIKT